MLRKRQRAYKANGPWRIISKHRPKERLYASNHTAYRQNDPCSWGLQFNKQLSNYWKHITDLAWSCPKKTRSNRSPTWITKIWSNGPGFHEIHVASAKVQQPRCKWQWRGPFFARLRLARLGWFVTWGCDGCSVSKRPKTNGVGENHHFLMFGCFLWCNFDVLFMLFRCVHDVLLSKMQVNKQYKNESGHPVHLVHNWFLWTFWSYMYTLGTIVTSQLPRHPLRTPEHASGAPNIGDGRWFLSPAPPQLQDFTGRDLTSQSTQLRQLSMPFRHTYSPRTLNAFALTPADPLESNTVL